MANSHRPVWFGFGGVLVLLGIGLGTIAATENTGKPHFWTSDPMLAAYGIVVVAGLCGVLGLIGLQVPFADWWTARQHRSAPLAERPLDAPAPARSPLREVLDLAPGASDLREALDAAAVLHPQRQPAVDLDRYPLDGVMDPAVYPDWCRACGLGLREGNKTKRRCQNDTACDNRRAIRRIEDRLVEAKHNPRTSGVHPKWIIGNYPDLSRLIYGKYPAVDPDRTR